MEAWVFGAKNCVIIYSKFPSRLVCLRFENNIIILALDVFLVVTSLFDSEYQRAANALTFLSNAALARKPVRRRVKTRRGQCSSRCSQCFVFAVSSILTNLMMFPQIIDSSSIDELNHFILQ